LADVDAATRASRTCWIQMAARRGEKGGKKAEVKKEEKKKEKPPVSSTYFLEPEP